MLCLHCTTALLPLILCVKLSANFANYFRDLISSGMHMLFMYLLFWMLLSGAYAQLEAFEFIAGLFSPSSIA